MGLSGAEGPLECRRHSFTEATGSVHQSSGVASAAVKQDLGSMTGI